MMNSRIRLKTAFTLIELLVVIAIVGILSGLIIVGMNSSIQSATIAKAQIFSNSLRDSLLANLVSEWKFDELSTALNNQLIKDSWNGGNNGTLYTGAGDVSDKLVTGSNCVYGKCLSFDGVGDFISTTNSIQNMGLNDFTVSGWIKFNSISSGGAFAGSGLCGTGTLIPGWQFGINWNNLEFYTRDSVGTTVASKAQNFLLNTWYYLAGTRSGTNLYVYINGVQWNVASGAVRNVSNSEALDIGRVYGANGYLNGLIDDIRIYGAAIPSSQIKEQYYAGIHSLLINSFITKDEYQQRLSGLINNLSKIN